MKVNVVSGVVRGVLAVVRSVRLQFTVRDLLWACLVAGLLVVLADHILTDGGREPLIGRRRADVWSDPTNLSK